MTEASAILLPTDREEAANTPCDFDALFAAHYARVVAVLFRLVGNRAQAEELADDVFLKLHRQPLAAPREGGQADHNWGGWLYRAATRAGIDALRAAARRHRYETEAAGESARLDKSPDPLSDLLEAERRRRVRDALAQMKPTQAQLLILRSGGFSYRELAEALEVKATSVGTLLARAEAEFEKRYRQTRGDEERR